LLLLTDKLYTVDTFRFNAFENMRRSVTMHKLCNLIMEVCEQ